MPEARPKATGRSTAGRYLLAVHGGTAVLALLAAGWPRISLADFSGTGDPRLSITVPEEVSPGSRATITVIPRAARGKTSVKLRLSFADARGAEVGSPLQTVGPQILHAGRPEGLSVSLEKHLKRAVPGWALITCIEARSLDEGSADLSPRHYCYRSRIVAR